MVTVKVIRNAGQPVFGQTETSVNVMDTVQVGDIIATVQATDNDKVGVLKAYVKQECCYSFSGE